MDAEFYMREAIELAKIAAAQGEVPVGAVVVKGDEIVGRGYNRREGDKNALSHAEIIAIDEACKKLGGWRLFQCDLYVTLEPCIMCAGAIIQSRIKNIFYGAKDFKGGAFGSSINILESKNINHYPNVEGGILEQECGEIISNYFRNKRKSS